MHGLAMSVHVHAQVHDRSATIHCLISHPNPFVFIGRPSCASFQPPSLAPIITHLLHLLQVRSCLLHCRLLGCSLLSILGCNMQE